MDDASSALRPIQFTNCVSQEHEAGCSCDCAKPIKKKRVSGDGSAPPPFPAGTADSSSSSKPLSYSKKVTRTALRRRNPVVLAAGVRRSGTDVEAIALPLGMSFAAVITQVLEKNGAEHDRMSMDHLSVICTSAVRESIANVFGDKFDCFIKNFEKSFGSTLKTLRLINKSSLSGSGCHSCHHNAEVSRSDVSSFNEGSKKDSMEKGGCYAESSVPNEGFNKEGSTSSVVKDCHPHVALPPTPCFSTIEEVQESMLIEPANRELALHGQMNQMSAFEKAVMEQTRSNELKTLELGISMRRLKLKETQLALNYESNHLEKSKLAMGVSKASFKAEKFKNQLEETRYSELHRKCIDLLVAGLFIMSVSLAYGAYVFSYRRIAEATAACTPSDKKSSSWWMPKAMTTFNSGLQIIRCQFQVMAQMLFGILMILLVAFLLLQRSTTSKDSKPVTFILLLLGVFCGFAGKICVDTLGGSGYHWLIYWEVQCLLHFLSNVCTPALFVILHGPIEISQGMKTKLMFPYWSRRVLFYSTVLLFLPVLCGFMPFGSIGEWEAHFSGFVPFGSIGEWKAHFSRLTIDSVLKFYHGF